MNWDLTLLGALGVILLLVFWRNKKRVDLQKIVFPILYLVIYRTQIGLKFMDRMAKKHPRLVGFFGTSGIYFGFLGMAVIFYFLIKGTFMFLFNGGPPPVAPLLPGIEPAVGIPTISFIHWIIAIFILAGVHEFSHGLVARLHNIKLKSSGFAVFSILLPIVPAAFVEPDEKELSKRSKKQQLAVLAAGSWSNFITAGIFILLSFLIISPLVAITSHQTGVLVVSSSEDHAAFNAGIHSGEKIIMINNVEIRSVEDFISFMNDVKPQDDLNIKTNEGEYSAVAEKNPDGENGYLGISVTSGNRQYNLGMWYWPQIVFWFSTLIGWIIIANIGVGLFNLLPLGPVDGGRMFLVAAMALFKNNEVKAKKLWFVVSIFCLLLIAISILPWFYNLFSPLFKPLLG